MVHKNMDNTQGNIIKSAATGFSVWIVLFIIGIYVLGTAKEDLKTYLSIISAVSMIAYFVAYNYLFVKK